MPSFGDSPTVNHAQRSLQHAAKLFGGILTNKHTTKQHLVGTLVTGPHHYHQRCNERFEPGGRTLLKGAHWPRFRNAIINSQIFTYGSLHIYGHGRRKGGPRPPWILKMSAQKGHFLSFEWEKSNFTTFAAPSKKFGKIPWWSPLEKILPTPMYVGFSLRMFVPHMWV